jgi:hypothetical protein
MVDLTYIIEPVNPLKSVKKVWLEFERYDPALYYPLGSGQYTKDSMLRALSKAPSYSGFYFFMSQAIKDQPETIVPEKSIVASGNTQWEGTSLKRGEQASLAVKVSFPEEGAWIIDALYSGEDGSVYVDRDLFLTVNQDSGTIGWPRYYEGSGGNNPANPGAPVGVYSRVGHAPSPGEEFPITTLVYSIEDFDQASAFIHFVRMDGYKYIDIPFSDIAVKGEDKWEGSLKKGTPIEFDCTVKFPGEGEWIIYFLTRTGPGLQEHDMQSLRLHIEKGKSCFGWLMDHSNPAVDKIWQEQLEKALHSKPTATVEGDAQKKTPFLDVHSQTLDSLFTIT